MGIFDMLVTHGTRLSHLTMDERDRLRNIAERAREINRGEARPEHGRLYADIVTMLHIIGGEFSEDQERLTF